MSIKLSIPILLLLGFSPHIVFRYFETSFPDHNFSPPPAGVMTTCSGNLGENIFANGDFGSGLANIRPDDPMIAPGYIYTTTMPPNDGYYTITNNTGQWNNIFSAWLLIGDNSTDPQGYMMVVNASYTPGLFYEQIITGLCENTLYEFSADVHNLIRAGVDDHSDPDLDFLINDIVRFSTGNVPKNQRWNTYGFTFSTGPGENFLKLSIRNNAPGGIGNDLALDNISFRPCGPLARVLPEQPPVLCPLTDSVWLSARITNNTFDNTLLRWQRSFDGGVSWQDIPGASDSLLQVGGLPSGQYLYRFLLANSAGNLDNPKCRILSDIRIVKVEPVYYSDSDTLCQGNGRRFGDTTYFESGVYTGAYVSMNGCDSIATLDLTILEDPGIEIDIHSQHPICSGDSSGQSEVAEVRKGYPPYSYFINDTAFATDGFFDGLPAGSYEIMVEDRYGCRGIRMLTLVDPEPLIVSLPEDLILSLGQERILSSFVNKKVRYRWFPEEGLSCTDCAQPLVKPLRTTTYSLEVTDSLGCSVTDSIRIEVSSDYNVFIPTAFSPNADGVNDYFTVYADPVAAEELRLFQVYDRWGELVFESRAAVPNDERRGWDGTFRGKPVDSGVYVYLAEVVFIDGTVRKLSGTVAVVR